MGKYKISGNSYEIRLEEIQRAIANELAEANRLKRLELMHVLMEKQKNKSKYNLIDELLEDKA